MKVELLGNAVIYKGGLRGCTLKRLYKDTIDVTSGIFFGEYGADLGELNPKMDLAADAVASIAGIHGVKYEYITVLASNADDHMMPIELILYKNGRPKCQAYDSTCVDFWFAILDGDIPIESKFFIGRGRQL